MLKYIFHLIAWLCCTVSYNSPENYGSPVVGSADLPQIQNYGSAQSAAVISNNLKPQPSANFETNYKVTEVVDNIKKPSSESERAYQGQVLKNGLKITLVSDTKSNYSAAQLKLSPIEQINKIEEKYKTHNVVVDRPSNLLTKLMQQNGTNGDDTQVPKPNRFLSHKALSIEKFDSRNSNVKFDKPRIILEDGISRLWYINDTVFGKPNVINIEMTIRFPGALNSPKWLVINTLLAKSLSELISNELPDAKQAGYSMYITSSRDNKQKLWISISGHKDKMLLLIEEYFTTLAAKPLTLATFQNNKRKLEQELIDEETYYPVENLLWQYYNSIWGSQYAALNQDFLTAVRDVNFEDVQWHRHQIFRRCHFEALIHGLIPDEKALILFNKAINAIQFSNKMTPMFNVELGDNRLINLPNGANLVFEKMLTVQRNKTATCTVFQIETPTIRDQATLELLDQVIKPAFSELRTREQLGYWSFSFANTGSFVSVLIFQLSGPYNPLYVEYRIEEFVKNVTKEILPKINETQFESIKTALTTTYLDKLTSTSGDYEKYWTPIRNGNYFFNKELKLASEVGKITQQDLLTFTKKHLNENSPLRRKLSIHLNLNESAFMKIVNSKDWQSWKKKNSNRTKIGNIREFKKSLPLYAWPKPHMDLKLIGI